MKREPREQKKVQKIHEKEFINHITGEIIGNAKDTTYSVPAEPEFVKIYLQDIIYLHDMPTSYHAVLYELLKIMDFENMISITLGWKKRTSLKLDLNVGTISNIITKLCKSRILERTDVGDYRANPSLFAKGKWIDIYKLRLTIDYDLKGRSFNTEIKKNEVRND
jgi:hypothetical protein